MTGIRKQYRIVRTGNGTMKLDPSKLHKVVGGTTDESGGTLEIENITDYRSEFEADNYLYSGYYRNFIPVIKRVKDNIEQIAQNVTDLETDWNNRLTLTYI